MEMRIGRRAALLVATTTTALVLMGGTAFALDILGTTGNDLLNGTDEADKIEALAGDDLIFPGPDNDTVIGGDGVDQVDAFHGDDVIYGGPGSDNRANGSFGLLGAEDSDTVYGGDGSDLIDAAIYDSPMMNAEPTVDRSYGGRGNDTILAKDGNKDIIDCGETNNRKDRDIAHFDAGLDTVKNCEVKNPEEISPTSAKAGSEAPARR